MSQLPTLNAVFNTTSALFLCLGYYSIRRGRVQIHRACMLTAFGSSILFLISYLIYHSQIGSKPFPGQGAIRVFYFALLLSHTVLAAAVVPMALITVYRAWKEDFARHRKLARWTLPVWLYVSVTGVLIYWMLYHLYGG